MNCARVQYCVGLKAAALAPRRFRFPQNRTASTAILWPVHRFFRAPCTFCRSVFQSDTEYGHRHANDKGSNANDHIRPRAVPQQHPAVAFCYRHDPRCLYASEKNADTGQKKQAAQCQAGKQSDFISLSVLPCPASYLSHPGFRLTSHPITSLHVVF